MFSNVLAIEVNAVDVGRTGWSAGSSNSLAMLRLAAACVSSAFMAPNAFGETSSATLTFAAAPQRAASTAEDERTTSASPSFA